MTLKQARQEKGLTQIKCAEYLRVPLRTYKRYEADETKADAMKLSHMLGKLSEYGRLDEEHGVLSVEKIREICGKVFADYGVEYAYLFGSYAKGKAGETSDVDLLVSVSVSGLKFFELVEVLRENLHKRVDLLDLSQLANNPVLTNEILKEGVRIYG